MIPESTILPSAAVAHEKFRALDVAKLKNENGVIYEAEPPAIRRHPPDPHARNCVDLTPSALPTGRARILTRIRNSFNLRKIGVSESVRRCMCDDLDVRFIDLADGASHLSPEMPMAESRARPRVWRRDGRNPFGS